MPSAVRMPRGERVATGREMTTLLGVGGFAELITARQAGRVPATREGLLDHVAGVATDLAARDLDTARWAAARWGSPGEGGREMRVFVSHAGRDRAWAEWVGWQLEHAGWGIEVELDSWDWHPGDSFVERMNGALSSCDVMVAVCSAAYYETERWTNEEWTAALAMAKERPRFLVPLRVDDTPAPPLLAGLIASSLHAKPRDEALRALLEAVRPPGRPELEPQLPGAPGGATPDEDGPRMPGTAPSVWGAIPGRNEAFTGRDHLFADLRREIHGTGGPGVHALHGAGGTGKTQVATEYAWRFASEYDAVWWVNAENAELVMEQFAEFAAACGLAEPGAPVAGAFEALRAFCRRRGRWLVVLDNAASANDAEKWVLPGPGHTIITSRDGRWREVASPVEVLPFDREESTALLGAVLHDVAEDEAEELAEALGDLPLALSQAANLLTETSMGVAEYRRLLDAAPAALLDEGVPVRYPQSLAKATRVAAERLAAADPVAMEVLNVCAFLAHEPVPVRWFTGAPATLSEATAAAVGAPVAFRTSVARLARFGLARLADDRLTVHRLVQRLLRADAVDPGRLIGTAEDLLATQELPSTSDPSGWASWSELLPHLLAMDLAETGKTALAWQACEGSRYLLRRGELFGSLRMIEPLYRRWLERHGPYAWSTLWAGNYLAGALSSVGDHGRAAELYRERLDRMLELWGPDRGSTLVGANNLAETLIKLGEREQARALLEDVLVRRHGVLSDDDIAVMGAQNNLASVLHDLGEHERARALHEDTLQRRRRVLGEDHPDSLASAGNLAAVLLDLGEVERARALHEDTLRRRREVMGSDHPDTLSAAYSMTIGLLRDGAHERARVLGEDTLTRRRRVLGVEHPDTLDGAVLLGIVLERQGDHAGARDILVDVRRRRRSVQGPDDLDALDTTFRLAGVLHHLEEYGQARALFEDVLARRRRILGPDHRDTLGCANDLGITLSLLGELEQARLLLEDTLDRQRAVLGADHPDVAGTTHNLDVVRSARRRDEGPA